jgi:hypothetical protein
MRFVKTCNFIKRNQRLEVPCCLLLEVAGPSGTLIHIYQTKRRHILEVRSLEHDLEKCNFKLFTETFYPVSPNVSEKGQYSNKSAHGKFEDLSAV